MHPGRRWPSMAMTIILIGALLLIGYTNTETINTKKLIANTAIADNSVVEKKSSLKINKATVAALNITSNSSISSSTTIFSSPKQTIQGNTIINTEFIPNQPLENKKKLAEDGKSIPLTSEPSPAQTTKESSPAPNKADIKNYSSENIYTTKNSVGKFGLQVYASPSVIYSNNSDNGFNPDGIQQPSIGLEVGAAMQYALFKKIKVKTGLQLNYTSYNSLGYFGSTTNAIIKQSLPNQGIENTGLTNTTGLYPVNFRSETYQVSLPVGVELKLLGKEKLHWDIGATIQPTYVMAANLHGTKESTSLNNWNLNAGFETFVTYKVNGLTWQLGPQFRYQIMSTYGKNYTSNENLANYGVKLGVSKVLP